MSEYREKLVDLTEELEAVEEDWSRVVSGCREKLADLAEELAELTELYLFENSKCYFEDALIDIMLLELDKEAKRSLSYKARKPARLPVTPKINKMWTVKPTIRARLPIH